MRHTSPRVAKVQEAVVRSLSGNVRLRQALEASDMVMELAMTRLRLAFPALPEHEVVNHLLRERIQREELPPALR